MANNTSGAEVVTGARFFISDGRRTNELHHILSHSVNDGSSAEVIRNANGKSIGTNFKGGGYTINLKVRSTQKKREVAWVRMKKSKVFFRFDIQTSRTRRDQYIQCVVATVNENSAEGEQSLDVTLVATDVEPIDLPEE